MARSLLRSAPAGYKQGRAASGELEPGLPPVSFPLEKTTEVGHADRSCSVWPTLVVRIRRHLSYIKTMGVWGSLLLVLGRMSYVIFGTERGSDKCQELGQHETPLSCVCCPRLPFDPLCGHLFPGSSCFLRPQNLSLHAVADLASLASPALQPYSHG